MELLQQNICNWFKSYLTARNQQTFVNGLFLPKKEMIKRIF